MTMKLYLSLLTVTCLLVAQVAQAQHSITFDGLTTTGDGEIPVNASPTHSGVTDFSNTGLDLGTAGYWFFNFDANAAVTDAAPESNEREALPSWITVDKVSTNPTARTLADGGQVNTSSGGQAGWSTLTLPTAAAETGLSGAVIAPGSAGDSANIFEDMFLGAGTPASFLMHIVVDNTNGDNDTDKRMKMRARIGGITEVNMRLNNLQDIDGSPDVYSFRFDGWEAGDELRLQVRNYSGFEPSSMAGIMFDVVPEPSSIMMMVLGIIGIGYSGARRLRK